MKAAVDADLCIGCGLCEEMCPEVFKVNDRDIAEAKPGEVPPDAEDSCRDAAEECPVEAISVE